MLKHEMQAYPPQIIGHPQPPSDFSPYPLRHQQHWGWGAVILATFFIRLTVPSLKVAFGVVYLGLTQEENKSNVEASLVMGVFAAAFSLASPVGVSLSLHYSHRKLTFAGILLISVGLAMCSFFLNLPLLILCYGLLGGIGYSLATTNSFLVLQKCSTRRRVLANFISSFGSSLSFIIMPIFVYILIINLSLRGAFLIWSGVILQGLVGTMFYHSSSSQVISGEVGQELTPISSAKAPFEGSVQNLNSHELGASLEEERKFSKSHDGTEDCLEWNSNGSNISMVSCGSADEYGEFQECRIDRYPENKRPSSFLSTALSVDSFKTMKTIYMSMESTFASLEYLDILGIGSLSQIRENEIKRNLPDNDANSEVRERHISADSGIKNTTEDPSFIKEKNNQNVPYVFCGIYFPNIKDLISFKPMTNITFLVYAISSIINKQVHLSYIMYLPLIAIRTQSQHEIIVFLAIVASGEFVSTFCATVFCHKKWMPLRHLNIMLSFVNSISCLMLLYSKQFVPLAVAAASLGLGMGAVVAIDPLLLLESVTSDLLPRSYGLLLLSTGIFSVVVFPIQGWTLDATGSFHTLGIMLSVFAIIPAILWIMVAIFCPKK